ncbi:MAG: hypothetical protein HY709_08190 [Candidatus Latescibacteria bacterium]|nr:hypothetical protein [Candidatus Latescibacterota bacterium]
MKGIPCYFFLLLSLGLLSRVIAGEETLIGQMEATGPRVKVFWFFRDTYPDEEKSASAVEAMITGTYLRNDVLFIGVVVDRTDSMIVDRSEKVRLSFHAFSARYGSELKGVVDQLNGLMKGAESAGDGIVVCIVDQRGHIRYRDTSYQPSVVLREVETILMTTKVDESTWGKIKELFR